MTETFPAQTRSLVFRLLETYCERNGLRLTAADPHGHAGLVESPAGKRSFFKGTRFDLNSYGAAEIANDKAYAALFLKQAGLAVPTGRFISGAEIRDCKRLPDTVLDFAEQTGFPLFVKPNTGREGRDVMRIDTYHTLQNALHILAKRHDQLLLQEEVKGTELRVIVLDGEILAAIERHPPKVEGDGHRTLAELIDAEPRINATDSRLDLELSQHGRHLETVPAPGQTVTLLPVANLSSGGTARIVTSQLSPGLAAIARRAAETLNLRYAAVDLILPDERHPGTPAIILEVNAAPGLSNLSRQGEREAALVESIYAALFAALFVM
ncbi:ATP-dependent carboxylate-amine ligase [Roseibium marinum]|uniref:D-alanine-D-alanine ligase-like ATP-grasp enzyme n=1 Tax=Roseibium marinum TaxID=281252 RepID=A0A2S3UYT7_9HYPH|nr:ATP-dependent carboxylate-amine ligase [Roseibium marinum]POF32815.1 D-alanine-D-alanine ligase-like ATP-grasp enzyme [Roseibium marinum]